jgi:cysteine desulfurase
VKPIYLDYNASTPVDPVVVEAMEPYLRRDFGNPSSDHAYGYRTKSAVRTAREQVAELLDVEADEVIFTSGGSEANNLAIKGIAYALRKQGNHLITSAVEHPSVTRSVQYLQKLGWDVSFIPVDSYGRVSSLQVAAAITERTVLISIMQANNEVGTIQAIRAIAEVAHRQGVLLHTDASQTIGKLPVSRAELDVDLLSVAGHKFYAPQGVGALIVRHGLVLEPLIHGAGHENHQRAGTENVASLVGLGQAAVLARQRLVEYTQRTLALRDILQQQIVERLPFALLNGHPVERLPNTLNLSFPGIDAAQLLSRIRDHVACSTGSACHAGRAEPSAVLLAMGQTRELASAALRLSLGWNSTKEEVLQAAAAIAEAVASLQDQRELS